jgi:hypothetical protein
MLLTAWGLAGQLKGAVIDQASPRRARAVVWGPATRVRDWMSADSGPSTRVRVALIFSSMSNFGRT